MLFLVWLDFTGGLGMSYVLLILRTNFVNWSVQAIRILSQVAGLSIKNTPSSSLSFLADAIASLMAKNTEAARNSGGSPTAYETINIK